MPRKKIAKRNDGRFCVSMTVHGKRMYFYSSVSKRDAEDKRDAYKAAHTAATYFGLPIVNQSVTLNEWAAQWLTTKEPKVKASTYETSYRRPIELYLLPEFGNRFLSEIKPIEIDAYLAKLGEKYSAGTVSKVKMCLSAMYESAIDNGVCSKNPCRNATVNSKIEKNEKRTYTAEQRDSIVAFAKTDPYGLYIRLLLEVGLRCSELCGLKWSDFDIGTRTLHVQRAATDYKGMTVVAPPKSKTSIRDLPLSSDLCAALAAEPLIGTDAYVVESGKRKGMPLNPKNFTAKRYKTFFDRYVDSLPKSEGDKFPRLTPHELRHTCGTLLYANSKNIYAVSKYLGHSDVSITAKLYVHNDIDILRESLRID